MSRRSGVALLIACGGLAAARPARADEAPPDPWDPAKARVRPLEIAMVPALGAGMLAIGLAAQGSTQPKWTGENAVDDAVRDGLRGRSESVRQPARVVSDVLFIGMSAYPVVIDAILLAGVVHRRWEVALRILVSYGQAGLGAGVLTVATQGFVFRARPLVDECARDGDYDPMCGSTQLSRSFVAGHPAAAFSAAGSVCQNVIDWPLYGGKAAGIAACASMMTLATTTGALRIVADKHWASDVVIGSAIGLAAGLVTPWIARRMNRATEPATAWTVTPLFTQTSQALVLGATF